MSNEQIAEKIISMGYKKEKIIADSAEPKSIDRLKALGLYRIKSAQKGQDSINHGIDFIQDFEIIIHKQCVNFKTEIQNYTWAEDKNGTKINKPIDDFNHLMDAMRYGLEEFSRGKVYSFE
jgi:phage terminase large subunit